MHLINTDTLELEDFTTEPTGLYAILSHRWEHGEILFSDMLHLDSCNKHGLAKLKGCCHLAREHGYRYCWIDTCCIDKKSSAELSEAINSMFRWYANAAVCYVYLSDLSCNPEHDQPIFAGEFAQSVWFTRCWTLQELLAPKQLSFYNCHWQFLGSRCDLADAIAGITRIDLDALNGADLSFYSIAERMSWASDRQCTRTEDTAYSLLGIFNINMPMLYGEGVKAFERLQEEILKSSLPDESMFAWQIADLHPSHTSGLLATDPSAFSTCRRIKPVRVMSEFFFWMSHSHGRIDQWFLKGMQSQPGQFMEIMSSSLLLTRHGLEGEMLLAGLTDGIFIAMLNAVETVPLGLDVFIGVYVQKVPNAINEFKRVSFNGRHRWTGPWSELMKMSPIPCKIIVRHKPAQPSYKFHEQIGVWLDQKQLEGSLAGELRGGDIELAPKTTITSHNDLSDFEVLSRNQYFKQMKEIFPAVFNDDSNDPEISSRTSSETSSKQSVSSNASSLSYYDDDDSSSSSESSSSFPGTRRRRQQRRKFRHQNRYLDRGRDRSCSRDLDCRRSASRASSTVPERQMSPYQCDLRYIMPGSVEQKNSKSSAAIWRPIGSAPGPICNIRIDGTFCNLNLIHLGFDEDSTLVCIMFDKTIKESDKETQELLGQALGFTIDYQNLDLSEFKAKENPEMKEARFVKVVCNIVNTTPFKGLWVLRGLPTSFGKVTYVCDQPRRGQLNYEFKDSYGWKLELNILRVFPKILKTFSIQNMSKKRTSLFDSQRDSRSRSQKYRRRSYRRSLPHGGTERSDSSTNSSKLDPYLPRGLYDTQTSNTRRTNRSSRKPYYNGHSHGESDLSHAGRCRNRKRSAPHLHSSEVLVDYGPTPFYSSYTNSMGQNSEAEEPFSEANEADPPELPVDNIAALPCIDHESNETRSNLDSTNNSSTSAIPYNSQILCEDQISISPVDRNTNYETYQPPSPSSDHVDTALNLRQRSYNSDCDDFYDVRDRDWYYDDIDRHMDRKRSYDDYSFVPRRSRFVHCRMYGQHVPLAEYVLTPRGTTSTESQTSENLPGVWRPPPRREGGESSRDRSHTSVSSGHRSCSRSPRPRRSRRDY